MNSTKIILIWILGVAGLAILFILSSTNLLLKDKSNEVYNISVVIADSSEENYVNFKRGVNKAAIDYNVDINFITLNTDADISEQISIIDAELEAGTSGIILEPAWIDTPIDSFDLLKEISEKSENIVLIGAESYGYNFDTVGADYEVVNEEIINNIINKRQTDKIYFFAHGLNLHGSKKIYSKITEELDSKNIEYELIDDMAGNYDIKDVIEEISNTDKKTVFISLDKDSFNSVVNVLEEEREYKEKIDGVYGVGSTTYLLNELDKGVIDGLITWNEYDLGYMSVKRAVEYMIYKKDKSDFLISPIYITKKDLQETVHQRMLYPID